MEKKRNIFSARSTSLPIVFLCLKTVIFRNHSPYIPFNTHRGKQNSKADTRSPIFVSPCQKLNSYQRMTDIFAWQRVPSLMTTFTVVLPSLFSLTQFWRHENGLNVFAHIFGTKKIKSFYLGQLYWWNHDKISLEKVLNNWKCNLSLL